MSVSLPFMVEFTQKGGIILDRKFAKIASELVDEYMPSIQEVKGQEVYQLYETMIKLNAEMLATALEKYEKSTKN